MTDPIERQGRIQELCRRLRLPSFEPVPAGEDDSAARTLRQLEAMDAEPSTTLARQLISDGIELPPPDTLSGKQVHDKLWQVIHGMARHRTFLHSTNHFSDHDLYRHLWENTLNDPSHDLDDVDLGDSACHIDFISDGSEESNRINLQFYADESEREEWRKDFPDDVIPEHRDPPFDRDRHLPQRLSRPAIDIRYRLNLLLSESIPMNEASHSLALGRFDEAHADLDRANEDEDMWLEVHVYRMELFLLEERWEEAVQTGEVLCEFLPDDPDHFINLAYAQQRLGRAADALQTFYIGPEEELEALPVYHYNRACCEALYGDHEDARWHLAQAMRMDPWFRELARTDPDLESMRGSGTGSME